MMKSIKKITVLGLLIISLTNCQDILDVNPKGIIIEDQLNQPEHVDGLVTAAYAFMPRTHPFETQNPFIASLRSDDAYKGGGGLNDQTPWYQMEVFTLVNPSVGNNDGTWYRGYQGISRTNRAISAIQRMDEAAYPEKQVRLAEMRFLRGWIHFKLKRLWKWIPYVAETDTPDDIVKISNHPDDMANDLPLWQKIADDFKFAADNLPPTQQEVGRANKFAAKAYLAQTLLWMAYPQNETHQVTSIDRQKLEEALVQVNDIIASGQFSLAPDFSQNFLPAYDNRSPESLWELQFTTDDGTPRGNLNEGNGLTAPYWTPHFICCDFHKATYNMVNAFRVDAKGLPLFDTFDNAEITVPTKVKDSYQLPYFANNTWDPRLGHTVGIPDFPWKYQAILYDSLGSRDPKTYGYMHSMKENVPTNDPGLANEGWSYNSMNQIEVRYAEVLLWKAEILVQLGRQNEALPIINQIRERAANSVSKLKLPNGTYPVTYKVEPYVDGVNITWNKETAWEALIWEDRLEMAMEGRRFFNLVRWGIAEKVMNAHFEKERVRSSWLNVARFNTGRDEYLPIPQAQMNWGQGVYKQNPGY